jgi:hypothetical protein
MMTLTAHLFQQILTSLRSDTGRRFNEQRMGPRVGVRGKIKILRGAAAAAAPAAEPAQPPFEVWVRDVSISGIGLLSSEAMTAGTHFRAHFPKVDDLPLTLVYTVVHCKSVSKGLYVIGARLADIPQPQAPRPSGTFSIIRPSKSASGKDAAAGAAAKSKKEAPAESAAPRSASTKRAGYAPPPPPPPPASKPRT